MPPPTHHPKVSIRGQISQLEEGEVCRVTKGHLRVTIGHLRVTIGNPRVTIGHLRVTIGHLRVTTGLLWEAKVTLRSL